MVEEVVDVTHAHLLDHLFVEPDAIPVHVLLFDAEVTLVHLLHAEAILAPDHAETTHHHPFDVEEAILAPCHDLHAGEVTHVPHRL